ncbi:hypothetical protein [Alteromonas sp. BMJM2]|uniref:hypothetical protein n=1 Tax=Alteromonas sp. BMJM2 TaxID=2954241 RepID=UPI0022B5C3AF|nr:hypothetical protein [Alteromonas sp. BMJM2]
MASPITWRNIGAPDFSSANQLGVQAGNQINQGITQLSNAAKQVTDNRLSVENQTKDFNTNQFLNQVQGFNDLGSYDKFNQRISTELGQLGAGQVDVSQVQSALQGRDNELRTDLTQTQEFDARQQRLAAEPEINKVNALIAAKDYEGARALIDSSQTIKDKGTLLSSIETSSDADREEKFKIDERNRTLDLRGQKDTALGIRNEALESLDDPTKIEDFVQGRLREAGVTDSGIIANTVNGLQADYEARNGLTKDQQYEVSRLQKNYSSAIDNAARDIDIMSSDTPTYSDELGHFLDTNNTVANAMKYVGEQSDKEVGGYELWDIATQYNDSRWGGNAVEMADKALQTAVENLEADDGMASLLTGPDAERIKGAAVKYAMDAVSNSEGGGWTPEAFQKEIEKGITLFSTRNDTINAHTKKLKDLIKKQKTIQSGADASVNRMIERFKQERRN